MSSSLQSHSAYFTACTVPAGAWPPAEEAAFFHAQALATSTWGWGHRLAEGLLGSPLGWEMERETVRCREKRVTRRSRGSHAGCCWSALHAGTFRCKETPDPGSVCRIICSVQKVESHASVLS